MARFLDQRCYLVVVSSSDIDSAYRIFSVMNDRGLNLSPTDILKAEIIGLLPENRRSTYTKKWDDLEEGLGRENFRNLFAHIRMIYMQSKQQQTLAQEFRESILTQTETKGGKFIDDVLIPSSESYLIVLNGIAQDTKNAEEVNKYLRYLRRLDNSDWVPPAIAFFKRYENNFDAILKFARDLERLAYALFIRRARINERISRYVDVLRSIEKGYDLYEEASLQLQDQEKSEVLEALGGPIYKTRFCKPLLLRLDSLLADAGARYDHKIISVEHVLPQDPSPGSKWLELFPCEEERKNWTHKIANLLLLSRSTNTKAQNYEFERKKREYFEKRVVTTFALTSQVLNESEWTVDVLEKRQRELLEKLKKEWRL